MLGFEYLEKIKNEEILANKHMKKLADKLLSDLEKSKADDYPYYYDEKKAKGIISFTKLFKFADGPKKGEVLKLAEWQYCILLQQFCWRKKDNPKVLRFTQTLVYIPRKNGKSYIISLLGLIALMLESYGEIYSAAVKYEQAKIIVRAAMKVLRTNKKLAKLFKMLTNEIRFNSKYSIFTALPSNPAAMDGVNPSLVAIDEANCVDPLVRDSLISGTIMRPSISMFYITTEYQEELKTGWLDDVKDYSIKVLDGIIEDERMLAFIYQLDNAEEVYNIENWIKANPIIDTIGIEPFMDSWNKAKHSPALLKNFLIKNMNVRQLMYIENSYIKPEKLLKVIKEKVDFTNLRVYVGVDLSKTNDLTAVSILAVDENGKILAKSKGFLPEESLENRTDNIDYRLYHNLGYCEVHEGPIINYDLLEEYIRKIEEVEGCTIEMICFDPHNSSHLMSRLSRSYNCVEVKQNMMTLSLPTKRFREEMYTENMELEKNDLLTWCFSNAVEKEDHNGNITLDKSKSKQKIDLAAATIFGFVELMTELDKNDNSFELFGYC